MLNLAVMTGRLVGDPELRRTNNDIAVASFRIAVKRDFGKKGEEETDFFDIVAWRGTAEFIYKWFQKGSMIQVAGRLQNRHWKDKHDQPRVSAELIADNVYFGDSKDKSGDTGGSSDSINPFEADDSPGAPPPNFDPFS